MNRIVISLLAAAALMIAAADSHAGSAEPPVLVELFTSQGCSSCPAAERFVADELVKRADVIALSLHVSYWDYIGWEDPFASAATTGRQRAYGQRIGRGRVYTPQIVVGGLIGEVGSNRGAVRDAIDKIQSSGATRLAIDLAMVGDSLVISIPGAHFTGTATVWLARYDAEHVTEVTRGENTGRTLRNVNVVRELRKIGSWTGQSLAVSLPASILTTGQGGDDGCVIIVQEAGFGRVLGARMMAFDDAPS